MSMIVAHNLPGMNVQRRFGASARGMSGAMEKLSSGLKINTGKDDPAGLLISEKLRSQMNGITRAKQNTEEAMNVMGIAEGAMNEMSNTDSKQVFPILALVASSRSRTLSRNHPRNRTTAPSSA